LDSWNVDFPTLWRCRICSRVQYFVNQEICSLKFINLWRKKNAFSEISIIGVPSETSEKGIKKNGIFSFFPYKYPEFIALIISCQRVRGTLPEIEFCILLHLNYYLLIEWFIVEIRVNRLPNKYFGSEEPK
jgi:hypothetical protein